MVGVPDQLCLMQHAMMMMWRRAHGRDPQSPEITLEDYEEIGGLAGALSQHADEIFDGLASDRHREIAEVLFRRLTEGSGRDTDVRRPATFGELLSVTKASRGELTAVINAFRGEDRSFLTPAQGDLGDDTIVDITHESLIRQWHRLKDWARNEFASAEMYRRLEQTAELWKEGQAALWTTPDLENALSWRELAKPSKAWAKRYGGEFDTAMGFLEQSRQRASSARWQRLVGIVAIVLILPLGIAAAVAINQWNNAESSRAEALAAKTLSDEARDEARSERDRADTARKQAETERQRAEDESRRAEQWKREAIESQYRSILERAEQAIREDKPNFGRGIALAGHAFATAQLGRDLDDDEHVLSNVITQSLTAGRRELYVTNGEFAQERTVVAYSADGLLLASTDNDYKRAVRISDTATGLLKARLPGIDYEVASLALTNAGTLLATIDEGGLLRLHRIGRDTPQAFRDFTADTIYRAMALVETDEGALVAAIPEAGGVQVWRVDPSAGSVREIAAAPGHTGTKAPLEIALRLALAPDGKRLVTLTEDGRVSLYDIGATLQYTSGLNLTAWPSGENGDLKLAASNSRAFAANGRQLYALDIAGAGDTPAAVQAALPGPAGRMTHFGAHDLLAVVIKDAERTTLHMGRVSDTGADDGNWQPIGREVLTSLNVLAIAPDGTTLAGLEKVESDFHLKVVRRDVAKMTVCAGGCGFDALTSATNALVYVRSENAVARFDPSTGQRATVIADIGGTIGAEIRKRSFRTVRTGPRALHNGTTGRKVEIVGHHIDADKRIMMVAFLHGKSSGQGKPVDRTDQPTAEFPGDTPNTGGDGQDNANRRPQFSIATFDLTEGRMLGMSISFDTLDASGDLDPRTDSEFVRQIKAEPELVPMLVNLQGDSQAILVRPNADADRTLVSIIARTNRLPQLARAENWIAIADQDDRITVRRLKATTPASASSPETAATADDEIQIRPPVKSNGIAGFGFAPDRKLFYVGYRNGRVEIWDLSGTALPRTPSEHFDAHSQIAKIDLGADGRTLDVFGGDGSAEYKKFDLRSTGRLLQYLKLSDEIKWVGSAADGRTFLATATMTVELPAVAERTSGDLLALAQLVTPKWLYRSDIEDMVLLPGAPADQNDGRTGVLDGTESCLLPTSLATSLDLFDLGTKTNSPKSAFSGASEIPYELACTNLHKLHGNRPAGAFAIGKLSRDVLAGASDDVNLGDLVLSYDLSTAAQGDPVSTAMIARRILLDNFQGVGACGSDAMTLARRLFHHSVRSGKFIVPLHAFLEYLCERAAPDDAIGAIATELKELAAKGDPMAHALLAIEAGRLAGNGKELKDALFHYAVAGQLLFEARARHWDASADFWNWALDDVETVVNLRRTTFARHLSPDDVLKTLAKAEDAIQRYRAAAAEATASAEPKFLADIVKALNSGDLVAGLNQAEEVLARISDRTSSAALQDLVHRASFTLANHYAREAKREGEALKLFEAFLKRATARVPETDTDPQTLARQSAARVLLGATRDGSRLPTYDLLSAHYAENEGLRYSGPNHVQLGGMFAELRDLAVSQQRTEAATRLAIAAVHHHEFGWSAEKPSAALVRALTDLNGFLKTAPDLSPFSEQLKQVRWPYVYVADQLEKSDPQKAVDVLRIGVDAANHLRDLFADDVTMLGRFALLHNRLGLITSNAGNFQQALKHHENDVAIRRRLTRLEPKNDRWYRNLAISLSNVAWQHSNLEDYKRAAEKYRETNTAWREARRLGHPDAAQGIWSSSLRINDAYLDLNRPIDALLHVFTAYTALSAKEKEQIGYQNLIVDTVKLSYPLSVIHAIAAQNGIDPSSVEECDRMAAHQYDPYRIAPPVKFSKIPGSQAVEACREAMSRLGKVPRLLLQHGRALSAANKSAQAVAAYRAAADLDYPIAWNNLGYMYEAGDGVDKDMSRAATYYLGYFNRLSRCCVADAVRYMLTQRSAHDPSQVDATAGALLSWAAALGNASAHEQLGSLYRAGTLTPPTDGLVPDGIEGDAAATAYLHFRLAEKLYGEDQKAAGRAGRLARELEKGLDAATRARVASAISSWKPHTLDGTPPWLEPADNETSGAVKSGG